MFFCCMLVGHWSNSVFPCAAAEPAAVVVTEMEGCLRQRLAAETAIRLRVSQGDALGALALMRRFYEGRAFEPAWSRNGRLTRQVGELVTALGNAETEGLRPADYHLAGIKYLLGELAPGQGDDEILLREKLVDLDLLLTDAFLLYGSHLLNGRVNPESIDQHWSPDKHGRDPAVVLDEVLAAGGEMAILRMLRPPHGSYEKLLAALAGLRDISRLGGWPVVADGDSLQNGMRHARVRSLRQRLMISGDYGAPVPGDEDLFDEQLATAVQGFQRRHGLKIDGIVGPETLAALNVPVTGRMRQIELNMERWRWVPRNLGRRHILVNIADFKLQVMEDLQKVLEMRVVVGKSHRTTPSFSDLVEYVDINPYWYLPETIIVEDMVPKILVDPAYLAQKKIKVFAVGSNDELDPATIDWARLEKKNLPYTLRQEPSPLNALGRVKIMFPNKYSVYLHDTPGQRLFQEKSRDFSSGCIRLENPLELVAYLLGDDPLWSREKIMASMESGSRQVVVLPERIPIHIFYWTAWSDENGGMHFRDDIYGWDKLLSAALDGEAPEPGRRSPGTYATDVHMNKV